MCEQMNFADSTKITLYGRNKITETSITFYETYSGFEVLFFGTSLLASFKEGIGQKLRIYLDNRESYIVNIESATSLATNLNEDWHRIKVLKVNCNDRGPVLLSGLSGPSDFKAVEHSKIKALFYGDSITVGYGVNSDGTEDTISNEDGTVTWAALLTEKYQMENQTLAASGISVGTKIYREKTMTEIMTHYSAICDDEYNFDEYVPDVVFINLGTNDMASVRCNGGNPQLIKDGYIHMIQTLKSHYPNAKIVCSYGMMSSEPVVTTAIMEAVEEETKKYSEIYFYHFNEVNCGGYNGHPSKEGQRDGFLQMEKFINDKKILDF